VRACVHACVHSCVHSCVRACVRHSVIQSVDCLIALMSFMGIQPVSKCWKW